MLRSQKLCLCVGAAIGLGLAPLSAAAFILPFADPAVGYEGSEIGGAGGSNHLTFKSPTDLCALSVGALFAVHEEGDRYHEQALVPTYHGGGYGTSDVLPMTGPTTADGSGRGTGVNVSTASFEHDPLGRLSLPFGPTSRPDLEFSEIGPAQPMDLRDHDDRFVSLCGREVPEPGPVALMGMGLAGLAVAGRRRTRA